MGDTVYVVGTNQGTPTLDAQYGTSDKINFKVHILNTNDPLEQIYSWDLFNGQLFIVAELETGLAYFYNGTQIEDQPYLNGYWCLTHNTKMYIVGDKQIYFSAIENCTWWKADQEPEDPGADPENLIIGAGRINTSTVDGEADTLNGIEVYYGDLAVFSGRTIQIWKMDADPLNNDHIQTMTQIGSAGRATPRQYGAGDILFLAGSGLRSLQARDSSNSGSISDIGSPIDEQMQEIVRTNSDNWLNQSRSMTEILTGRHWVTFRDQMWVLSLFPGPDVTAWSEYEPVDSDGTMFEPDELVDCFGYVVIRTQDNRLLVFGGEDRQQYDASVMEVVTPYNSMDRPATYKKFKALDFALDGTWQVEASYDSNITGWDLLGTFDKTSFPDQRMAMAGFSTMVSLRLRTTGSTYARLANTVTHYDLSRED